MTNDVKLADNISDERNVVLQTLTNHEVPCKSEHTCPADDPAM